MARPHGEHILRINIFWLNQHGFLPKGGGHRDGTLSWTWAGSPSGSAGVQVMATGEENYIRLTYTHTDSWSGEKKELDYKVRLTTTPCRFGGKRYWFVCPLIRDDVPCGRRVGVLFGGKYFGCRHCYNIAYNAQFEGGRIRTGSVTEPDVEKAYNEIKRFYYRGKPTHRYKRYLRLQKKMDTSWIRAAVKFGAM